VLATRPIIEHIMEPVTRLLFITEHYPPSLGGVAVSANRIVAALYVPHTMNLVRLALRGRAVIPDLGHYLAPAGFYSDGFLDEAPESDIILSLSYLG
jgi:hypothetical protein